MKKIGTYLLEGFVGLQSKLPLRYHYAKCRVISFLMMYVFRYRRKVVRINLEHSFPEKSAAEIRDITRKFYRHFGEILAETVWFSGSRYGSDRLRRQNICTTLNPRDLNEAYESTDGLVVLISHAGNWELIGGWFEYVPEGIYGFCQDDISVVYKKLSSPAWDHFMGKCRTAPLKEGYTGYIESRNILRNALEHKGQKHIYVFPTDQYPYRYASKHEAGSFLGQQTVTMTGAAALAHKLGMGVGMFSILQTSRGHYDQTFKLICPDASRMSPEEIMNVYYRNLEEDIKAQPWNYLWTHKRWKNLYSYK